MDLRKRFFALRVVGYWNILGHGPKPCLEFKKSLDNSWLNGLVFGSFVRSRELDSIILMGLFLLTILYDSVKDNVVHTALVLNVSHATSGKRSIF